MYMCRWLMHWYRSRSLHNALFWVYTMYIGSVYRTLLMCSLRPLWNDYRSLLRIIPATVKAKTRKCCQRSQLCCQRSQLCLGFPQNHTCRLLHPKTASKYSYINTYTYMTICMYIYTCICTCLYIYIYVYMRQT